MTLPKHFRDDDPLLAADVLANDQDLDGRFPVKDKNIGGFKATKLDMDGFILPPNILPPLGGSSAEQALSFLTSDPAITNAYGVPYVRRAPSETWPLPVGGGYPAPIADGVLLPSRTDARVYEIQRSSTASADTLYNAVRTHTFAGGDAPTHAVCGSPTFAFVSCDSNPPTIKKITLGGAGGAAADWLGVSASYSGLKKLCINRHGTYLYAIAKGAGDTYVRHVLRIDTATEAVSALSLADTDDQQVIDICVIYNGSDTAAATGEVFIATKGGIYRAVESTTGVYGGSFPSNVTTSPSSGTVVTSAQLPSALDRIVAMTPYRGKVAVVSGTAGTTVAVTVLSWERSPSSTGALTISWAGNTGAASLAASSEAIAVGTDGRRIAVLMDTGGLVWAYPGDSYGASLQDTAFAPGVTVSGTLFFPRATSYSGLAYTGRTLIGSLHKASDGACYPFVL